MRRSLLGLVAMVGAACALAYEANAVATLAHLHKQRARVARQSALRIRRQERRALVARCACVLHLSALDPLVCAHAYRGRVPLH